jgi:hypothetical protein
MVIQEIKPSSKFQIVTYIANADGYTADVKYEGVAQYPDEVKPSYKPVYAPAY